MSFQLLRRPFARQLILIVFFALVAFLMLYWPLFHSGTHVPGNRVTDYHLAHWSLWWIRHALTTPGLSVYETNYVMFPFTTNLAYHTLGAFWYPLWAALEPLVGTLAAMNAIFWAAATLRGWVFFLLLRREGASRGLALLGGVMLQVTPVAFSAVFWSNVNLMGWFWLPAHLLLWGNVVRAAKITNRQDAERAKNFLSPAARRSSLAAGLWAVALGVAFWAAAMTDLQYLLFTVFLLVPYGLWTLYKAGAWAARMRLVMLGLLAVAVTVALLWFVGPLQPLLNYDRSNFLPADLASVEGIPFPEGFLRRPDVYWLNPSVGLFWTVAVLASLIVALRAAGDSSPRLNRKSPAEAGLGDGTPRQQGNPHPDNLRLLPSRRQQGNPHPGNLWLLPFPRQQGNPHPLPFPRQQGKGEGGPDRASVSPSLLAERGPGGEVPRWLWFALILPLLILSVGPQITLFGAAIPMPYRGFHDLLGGTFRYPGRFAPVMVIAGMLFAGQVWTPILARLRPCGIRPLLIGLLLLLMLADLRVLRSVDVTLPLTPYEFYQVMGRETGAPYDDYVVVESPVAAGTGVMWIGNFDDTALQFYGLTHGKRMVNGLLSRTNPDYFWVLRDGDPLLSWIGQRRWLEPDVVEAELRRIIYEWPIGYIVIHQDRMGRQTPTPQEIVGYFNSLDDLLCPFAVEGDAVAYRTAWHPDGCPPRTPPQVEPGVYEIDIGSEGDERYLGWGWHWPETVFAGLTWRWIGDQRWTADDPCADLYADLPPGDYEVTLAAQAFWGPRELTLRVNGAPLGTVTVPTDALRVFTFDVPADVIGDGQHLTITLAYASWDVPVEVGQSGDERSLSVAVDWVRFRRITSEGR